MRTGTTRRKTFVVALVCACLAAPLGGCDGVKRVPVTGAVTLDGQPLQGGVLLFHPNESKGNTNRASCTGPVKNGRYTLVTSGVTRDETGQGAPLGWYKVTLINDLPGTPEIKVHPKYLKPETTPLEIEIVDDPKPGAYDLEMFNK
jgi:hypothetical protein